MSLIEILLIILCVIFGGGLVLATATFFFLKNKWNKRKKLKEEKMAANLYERLINEKDTQLRKEIENAMDEFNSEDINSTVSRNKNNKKSTQTFVPLQNDNNDDVLYAKCMNFVKKMRNSAHYFLEQNESEINKFINFFGNNFDFDNKYNKSDAKNKSDTEKYKTQVNDFSNRAFDFLTKNKKNINKIQKIKDIWNSEE